jgi:hypothetical protein
MVWISIQDFEGAGRLGMEFVCIRLVSIVTFHGSGHIVTCLLSVVWVSTHLYMELYRSLELFLL